MEKGVLRKDKFPPCCFYKKTNHPENNCWLKNKQVYHFDYCNKIGHTKKICFSKQNQIQNFPTVWTIIVVIFSI